MSESVTRVLHVDDNPEITEVAKLRVEQLDPSVRWITETTPQAGLEHLKEVSDIDCIVSDYDMPEMNGLEFYQEVRANSEQIPFILLTGKGDEDLASRAFTTGVTDYIRKRGDSKLYQNLIDRVTQAVESNKQLSAVKQQASQQEAIAQLGRSVLEGASVADISRDATVLLTDILDTEFAKVLELRSDELLLREGIGWNSKLVGTATVGAGSDSQAGYTLQTQVPVIVDDLTDEDRFSGPPLLTDHSVRSGISVVIGELDDPWGVLGTHSTAPRQFTEDDALFVQTIANTLSTAIERRQRIDELERYEKIIEALPVGVFRATTDGDLIDVNPAMKSMFGAASKAEFLTRSPADFYHEPADRSRLRQRIEEDGHLTGEEVKLERVDGSTFWALLSSILTEENGSFYYVGVVEDVTHRKDHEQALEAYQAELERSNAELEQFAYVASHDLQEPLRMVSSYVGILAEEYTDELDGDAAEFMEFAVDGAQRMQAMINGLLRFSRIHSEAEAFEPTDSDAVLADILSDLEYTIEEHDATIQADPLPTVECDDVQLGQVFQNLVLNAIVHAGDTPPLVHISANEQDEATIFSVADQGVGIDPDDQENIFEIFSQGHETGDESGTGIGLAIVKRIVERHGGDIWIDSTVGNGATFSFSIPHEHPSQQLDADHMEENR